MSKAQSPYGKPAFYLIENSCISQGFTKITQAGERLCGGRGSIRDFQRINYPMYSDYIFLSPPCTLRPAKLPTQRLVIFLIGSPLEEVAGIWLSQYM
jgi:hypothetical protein